MALAAFVAMVVIAPLQAAQGCQKKGDAEKMMGKGCHMGQGCMMLKNISDLSVEQKGKLEKLHAEHMKMMEAAKADMEKLAGEMKGLMKDPVDLKKVEAKIDEAAKMRAGMMKKCLAHRLAVRALLSDEQKAKLGEMGCGMGCGMMMGAMQGQGGCLKGGAHMQAKEGHDCQAGAKMPEQKKACCEAKAKAECEKKAGEEKK
jgi:Spy/CpxP family protein refolding chaperone